jgi:hypothetical protein
MIRFPTLGAWTITVATKNWKKKTKLEILGDINKNKKCRLKGPNGVQYD